MLVSLALLVLFAKTPLTDPKPHVKLVAVPRMSLLPYPDRREVHLLVVAYHQDENLWCPDIVVDWGDESARSAHSETCVALENAPPEERERTTWYNGFHEYWAGEFVITVTFSHNGKAVHQERTVVTIAR